MSSVEPPTPGSPRPPRVSLGAVLGTLVLVGASIAFGVFGPRMGQRGMRSHGLPVTTLRDAILDEFLEARGRELASVGGRDRAEPRSILAPGTAPASAARETDADRIPGMARRRLAEVFGSDGVRPPDLSGIGFDLENSRRVRLLGVDGVRLDYRSEATGGAAVLIELVDPLAFIHFDDFGRQQPLIPGTRIGEEIVLGGGMSGGMPAIGMVMIAREGRLSVIVAFDPVMVANIADELDPPVDLDSDSVREDVATILQGPSEPMFRT